MKILPQRSPAGPQPGPRRGAALLLSLLILFVLVAIVFQISIGTAVDGRVARNDITLTKMDLAIESALHEVEQLLISDAEASTEGGEDGGLAPGGDGTGLGAEDGGADPAAEGGDPAGGEAVDSRRDEFMRPQRTEINGIQLRILVQDEDSKYNLLLLASEDEEEALFAKEQLVRLFDLCREDTKADIDRALAEEMADEVRDHMLQRDNSILANPVLLTTDEENEDRGFPLSLRELAVLEPFELGMFRDFRDEDGNVVHSLNSYLTVWSSLAPASTVADPAEAGANVGPGEEFPEETLDEGESQGTAVSGGGFAVNVNTAPAAVLKCLFEDRDVPHRFWDDVVEYRNLEEEEEENSEEEQEDPPLDEFGEEIIERKIFEDTGELSEVDSYDSLEDEAKALVSSRLRTTSDVFSIYITARKNTSQEDDFAANSLGTPRERREQEVESGTALLRTVRSVVWRRTNGDGEIEIVPILRWEVLDYVPFEMQDFPEDER
jgi:type II secretory pathway component PulK